MAAPKIVPHARGATPDIRLDGSSVLYNLDIVGVRPQVRLVLRCDGDGTVAASIVVPPRERQTKQQQAK